MTWVTRSDGITSRLVHGYGTPFARIICFFRWGYLRRTSMYLEQEKF